ncbi:MAG: quinolinate synthase NadA [Deltaproteobacteria bacterium]|nr:quinolinate synthase NadA [Deltaproteobacteria bacterium]
MPDIFDEIATLKKQKNAVILAHYYQDGDIQDVADFVGDSLELSRKAATTDASMIVFAGVHFMAETAKILSPSKKVLLPDLKAGCSLASSCPPDLFGRFKARHPEAAVISYINCSAEIKALSDYICTSSNAEKILRAIHESRPIIFAPDRNLGAYLAKKIGRPMILWNGSCVVHEIFSEKKLVALKTRYPDAPVIAHPECEEPVLKHADYIGSTSGLLKFTQASPARQFIVVTESGILHQMKKASPDKDFIPAPPDNACACNDCPYMKLNTLEKLRDCLAHETPEITMSEDLRARALKPLERMLAIS